VRTQGYFQELGYYMDYTGDDAGSGIEDDDDDDDNLSWFPPVPSLVTAVAPPALRSAAGVFPTSNDDLRAAAGAPSVVHVRRCEKSGESISSSVPGRAEAASERVLSSGFYPALPAEYYLAALREADDIAKRHRHSGSSNTGDDGPVVIVAPENCRRSPLVAALLAAYPGRARLAAAEATETSVATDFGLLRGGAVGGGLVLSVGTFSFVAAWLALDDNRQRVNRRRHHISAEDGSGSGSEDGGGSFGPRSVHMPLAGCQRRFVPLQVPRGTLVDDKYRLGSSNAGVSSGRVFGTTCRPVVQNRSGTRSHGARRAASASAAAVFARAASVVVLHRPRPYYRTAPAAEPPPSPKQEGQPEGGIDWECEGGVSLPWAVA
jgi:hypothetical protein